MPENQQELDTDLIVTALRQLAWELSGSEHETDRQDEKRAHLLADELQSGELSLDHCADERADPIVWTGRLLVLVVMAAIAYAVLRTVLGGDL